MSKSFAAYRRINTVKDLLIVDQPARNGAVVHLGNAPYYAEICLWVTIRCSELDLFSDNGQTLVDATSRDGYGWRLSLSPHGYLRFEDNNPDPKERQCVDSHLPVHAVVSTEAPFKVGLCMSGGAWLYRATPYVGAKGSARLRLFAISGTSRCLSEIGGDDGIDRQELNPTPETMALGIDSVGGHPFAGQIERITAYNTCRMELFNDLARRPAPDALPLMPAGSSFEPRWVDGETIEVFTHPDFSASESYWVCLDLGMLPAACRRLRLWTAWHGGTNMTPTFFHSLNGVDWSRVIPRHVDMRTGDGRNLKVEFDVDRPLRQGGILASCPPFTEADREALLAWAGGLENTTVTRIGESVQGRPLHVIRLGRSADGVSRSGVAIICGQHSPLEIMGGRIIRPLIEQFMTHPSLLEHCNFYVVPTVNVDCQHYGGGGMNAHQRNTNRHWMVDLEPENLACVEYFNALKGMGQKIDFAVDIHAGGVFRNHLLMPMGPGGLPPFSEEQTRQQEQWMDNLEQYAGLRKMESRVLEQQNLRATDYFHQVHGAVAFCLELSTCSYYDPARHSSRPFGPEAFDVLAMGLIRTWEVMLYPDV